MTPRTKLLEAIQRGGETPTPAQARLLTRVIRTATLAPRAQTVTWAVCVSQGWIELRGHRAKVTTSGLAALGRYQDRMLREET